HCAAGRREVKGSEEGGVIADCRSQNKRLGKDRSQEAEVSARRNLVERTGKVAAGETRPHRYWRSGPETKIAVNLTSGAARL
ncbi:MAG: hypothetical protein R6X14_08575, partial [bacterium]